MVRQAFHNETLAPCSLSFEQTRGKPRAQLCPLGSSPGGSAGLGAGPPGPGSPLPKGDTPASGQDRSISSLDSWENLPESPVSWLPSLLAECSVSPKGAGNGEGGPGEPARYRHTARGNRRAACGGDREESLRTASEQPGHPLSCYCISCPLLHQNDFF